VRGRRDGRAIGTMFFAGNSVNHWQTILKFTLRISGKPDGFTRCKMARSQQGNKKEDTEESDGVSSEKNI